MDRYRIAPARPVCLSAAGPRAHLRPGGPEIGIFTAERYFSAADVVHDRHELPRMSVPAADVASQSGRTAASSEASWNSRSGLLSGAHSTTPRQHKVAASPGAVYDRGGRKTGGQRWTLFGRDCPCAGRKAVVTVDAASEPRSPMAAHLSARFSPQSAVDECLESDIFNKAKHPSPPTPRAPARADHHQEPAAKVKVVTVTPGSRAFPIAATSSSVFSAAAPNHAPFAGFKPPEIDRRVVTSGGFTFPALGRALDEPPRLSLEVFRPIDEDTVMDPPTAMPFAGRAGLLLPVPVAAAEEEAMSDASSDLFDLESFAASSSYPTTYRGGRGSRRNSADDEDDDLPPYAVSGVEPALSECGMYPASEASVVWSVVTAEGGGGAFDAASVANFSSAASACCVDDLRYNYIVPAESSPEAAGFTAAMSRSVGRKKSGGGGGGFLNSCRCEKAVSVGPTPVRVVRPPAYPKKGGDGAARYHSGRATVPVRT